MLHPRNSHFLRQHALIIAGKVRAFTETRTINDPTPLIH